MKIEVTDLSPVKKSLAVEVDVEEVSKETEAVVRRYAGQVRLPGFRQGKAPVDMVRKRFAKEIDDDVRERLITRLWREATSEKGLVPLGEPVLEDLKHERGMPFGFKTTFEVLPQFEVKEYRGVDATSPSSRVDDGDVEEALESIRQSHARYQVDEARLAEPGDVIVADRTSTPRVARPKRASGWCSRSGLPETQSSSTRKSSERKRGLRLLSRSTSRRKEPRPDWPERK